MTISISEGMMNMLMGKIIFVGSFSTFSSAVNCRFRATDARQYLQHAGDRGS